MKTWAELIEKQDTLTSDWSSYHLQQFCISGIRYINPWSSRDRVAMEMSHQLLGQTEVHTSGGGG